MTEILAIVDKLLGGLLTYMKTAKARNTAKALAVAVRIEKIDRRIKRIHLKNNRHESDVRRIKALDRKKEALWESFHHYIAVN